MTSAPRIVAIVPAAGIGRRVGGARPKQYLPLGAKTVIEHTLGTLLRVAAIDDIVVALAAQDRYWPSLELATNPAIKTVIGGAQRSQSVFNSMQMIKRDSTTADWQRSWLLVHDVARPCVAVADINRLIETVTGGGCGGILASAATDTVKQLDDSGAISQTIDRDRLWLAQTPQLFPAELLLQSLTGALAAGIAVTDESSAMEWAGHRPQVVAGASHNIKITHAADLALAEFYLSKGTA